MKALIVAVIAVAVTVQLSLTAIDSLIAETQAAQVERVQNIDKQ